MKINVSDLNCQKCVEKISRSLLINDIKATVNLKEKLVIVDDKDTNKALEVIKNTGYTPSI